MTNTSENIVQDIARFEAEIKMFVPRYMSQPKADPKLELKDENGDIIPFFRLFPDEFEDWREVLSIVDRKSIIYKIIDQVIGSRLKLWQVIERYTDDRYALMALKEAKKATAEDKKDPNYWNALARAHFVLTSYADAEQCCLQAMELAKDGDENIRTRRIYADIMHLTGRQETAHQIYHDIIEARMPNLQDGHLSIQQFLGFEGDIVNSPIYARAWLINDKNATDDAWKWADMEFYYSPHFRSSYAIKQIQNKKYMEATAQLITLTREMPWFKEAVFNALELIKQLEIEELLPDDKQRLEKLIEANNWTKEDLNEVKQ